MIWTEEALESLRDQFSDTLISRWPAIVPAEHPVYVVSSLPFSPSFILESHSTGRFYRYNNIRSYVAILDGRFIIQTDGTTQTDGLDVDHVVNTHMAFVLVRMSELEIISPTQCLVALTSFQ